jgi:hypothetical protein
VTKERKKERKEKRSRKERKKNERRKERKQERKRKERQKERKKKLKDLRITDVIRSISTITYLVAEMNILVPKHGTHNSYYVELTH